MPLWTPYDIGLQIAAQAKWQKRGSTTLRMWGWLTFSDLRRQCPRCHIDTAAVLPVLYMFNQTDFQLHSRFQTTRWPLSSNDILHWPIFEGLLSVLTIFNAPNILPLPLIYRRKRADFVRVNETSTFLNIDFDDYLWKCVFTDSGFFF